MYGRNLPRGRLLHPDREDTASRRAARSTFVWRLFPKIRQVPGALGPAKLHVEVTYLDKRNFFNGVPRLFPYVSVLKTRYLNQGAPIPNVDEGTRPMDLDSTDG